MDILVGELARLYGLSSQSLHYYEEKGILNPHRSVTNGYRYYETTDLSRLGSIKKYRNAEFSLPDGLELYENATDWEIANYYQKQKEKLWLEIERKQYLMRQIDEDLALYTRYQRIGNKFLEENLEGFMCFESAGTQIIFQDNNKRKEATDWFKNIMYTYASYLYYIDEKTMDVREVTYGMVSSKLMARYLKLNHTESVSIIDNGIFLTSVMNTEHDGAPEDYIIKCLSYVGEHGYKLIGKPFSRTIFIYTIDDKSRKSYNIFYLPVKKIHK